MVRQGKWKNAQKIFEQTPNPSVYSCMTNGGIIEGNPRDILAFSDLSPVIGYAGRWTNIPEQSLLPLSERCRNSGGSGATLRAASLRKPAIEKEARLRSQHYFTLLSARGLMRGKKGNAAALLLAGDHYLPSRNRIKAGHYFFGGGETRMQMRSQQWFGGIVTGAPPRSQLTL